MICSRPNLYAGRGVNKLYFLFIGDRPRELKTFETAARPPSIARKPRTDAQFIASALLFFHRRKWTISFVRRTAFVLALKHPNGTKFYFLNSPQVQRFLDKSHDRSPIRGHTTFAMFSTELYCCIISFRN